MAKDKEPASRKLFKIPELLEHILLQMRIKDILINAQRVSKKWHSVIKKSKKLQVALFFEPLTLDGAQIVEFKKLCKDQHPQYMLTHHPRVIPLHLDKFVKMNPLVHQVTLSKIDPGATRAALTGETRLHGFSRWDASWRRMLLSQRPPGFTIKGESKEATARFGDLVDKRKGGVEVVQHWMLRSVTDRYGWQRVQYAYEVLAV